MIILNNKVELVTGGTGDIGTVICESLYKVRDIVVADYSLCFLKKSISRTHIK